MPMHFGGAAIQSYAIVGASPASTSPLTISVWFQVPTVPSGVDTEIAVLYNNVATDHYYGLWLSQLGGLKVRVRAGAQSNGNGFSTSTQITPNQWQHGAAVFYNQTTRAVFLNGGGKAQESLVVTQQATNTFSLAKTRDLPQWFSGQLAHVAIYVEALSDPEIAALARGFSPKLIRPHALGAYWTLEGSVNPEPGRGYFSTRYDLQYVNNPNQYGAWYPRIIEPSRQRLSVARKPVPPYNPSPANAATNVTTLGLVLSWSAGAGTASFNVYFGPASTGGVLVSSQTETSWTPPTVTPGVLYVWQVQAVNYAGSVLGPNWSFTAQPNLSPPAGSLVVTQAGWEVFADETVAAPIVEGVAPGIWHEFLVCGHALKSIDAWYVGGVRQPVASAQGDPATVAYFLIPGYSAWDIAFPSGKNAKTISRNGRVYTVIYALEDLHSPLVMVDIVSGTTPITLNVKGIEDIGDGSGALVTRSLDIYLHMMQNWVYGDYQAGSWLMSEAFIDGRPVIREASFRDAHEVSLRRIATGYVGGGAVGADGNFISARDLIRQLNLSCDVSSGLNRHCQFIVTMIDDDPTQLAEAPTLSDTSDILQGSFDIEDDFSNHFNALWYLFKKDYLTGVWQQKKIQDATSLQNYGEEFLMESQEYWFVRDEPTATDIAGRKLIRHKDPPRLVKFAAGSVGFNIELGNLRKIQHYGGVGQTGWTAQPVRVHKHIADVNTRRVDFEGYDMQRVYAQAFVLRDEGDRATTWTEAPTETRQYDGYLADERTGLFSTGEDAKRLR